MTRPGPDGFLWQLWGDRLQRTCEAEGCQRGLLLTPGRFCSACRGSGFIVKVLEDAPGGEAPRRSGQAVAAPAGTRAADFAAWWEAKNWWGKGTPQPPAYGSEAQATKDSYERAFLAGRRSGEEKERELFGLYADAVLCEDAKEFVIVLINRAEHAGFTKDGSTLTEAGQAALDGVMKAGTSGS